LGFGEDGDGDGNGAGRDSLEAEEIPEVDSPLDEESKGPPEQKRKIPPGRPSCFRIGNSRSLRAPRRASPKRGIPLEALRRTLAPSPHRTLRSRAGGRGTTELSTGSTGIWGG